MIRNVAALALIALALPAGAEERPGASPRWGTVELSLGAYKPNVDAEFGGGVHPWSSAFGNGRGLIFRVDFAHSFFVNHGSLDVGIGAGYFQKSGHGQLPDGTTSADSTSFKMIPLRASVTYRLDQLAERYGIPLAPYGRFSLSGGLAFLLDFIDPSLAREMDRDTGINHTYIFVDFTKSWVKDFGSSSSWDLSDEKVSISGGLMFVF